MNKLIFISLFLLVTSAPVDKAEATGFLSPLSDRPGPLDHLSSFPDASLPNDGAPRAPGTIKGFGPVHSSAEPDLNLLAQQSSAMADSASDSAGMSVSDGLSSQVTDTPESLGTTTTSGDKCELTENGIVCNDNSESQISRSTSGSDELSGRDDRDPQEAINKLKSIVDIFSNSRDR